MKKYIRINEKNVVQEILPEYVDDFPGVHISERYSPGFLAQCIVIDESIEVNQNWDYLSQTGEFKPAIKLLSNQYITAGAEQVVEIMVEFNTLGEYTAESEMEMTVNENRVVVSAPNVSGFHEIGIDFTSEDGRCFHDKIVLEVLA